MMTNQKQIERLSEIQDEILSFAIAQAGTRAEKLYLQGKVTDDQQGNVTGVQGSLRNVIVDGRVLDISEILSDAEFKASVNFVRPRIIELHDVLHQLQGKSPVRFRWSIETRTGKVESEWTYYDDLTDEEKKDDFWRHWKGDFAWKAQLEAEQAGQR